jgi:hypothetical protein
MNEKQTSLEKEKIRGFEDLPVAGADVPLEHVLQRLPTNYREEILKQYDLPVVKVSILTIFRYGTPLEYAMQIVGILFAIAAGIVTPPLLYVSGWQVDFVCLVRFCVTVDYCRHGQYDESVWKFYESWYSEFDSCPVG